MALSVSSTPEFWREILQLKGPTYELRRTNGDLGKFAIYCNDLINKSSDLAVENGYASLRKGYKATSEDSRIPDVFFDEIYLARRYAKAYAMSVATAYVPYPTRKFMSRWMEFFSDTPNIDSNFVTWCAIPEYVNMMLEEKFPSMDGFWFNDKTLRQIRGNILRHRFSFWQVV